MIAKHIIKNVSEFYGIDPYNPTNKRRYVDVRRVIYHLLRKKQFTFEEIGAMFGKDHATVLHGVRSHDSLVVNDKKYREDYYAFMQQFVPIADSLNTCNPATYNVTKTRTIMEQTAQIDSLQKENDALWELLKAEYPDAEYEKKRNLLKETL